MLRIQSVFRVLILVLMEYGRGAVRRKRCWRKNDHVLILVLMEYGRGERVSKYPAGWTITVLILVLMEYGRGEKMAVSGEKPISSS